MNPNSICLSRTRIVFAVDSKCINKFALLAMLISGAAFFYYSISAAWSLARAGFLDQIVK